LAYITRPPASVTTMPSKPPSTTARMSGLPASLPAKRMMPEASANSANTPMVESVASSARM
jgi:hypothetical protein